MGNDNRIHPAVILAIIALVVGFVLFPAVYRPSHGAPSAQCLSNVKQIATASAIYLSDYDDRMRLEMWTDNMLPYTKSRDIFFCVEQTREKAEYGYAMNTEVVGIETSKQPNPDQISRSSKPTPARRT
ncbi:MAG: hypothetical protein ABL949_07035 [Fimbriimonadaceae bacterium]